MGEIFVERSSEEMVSKLSGWISAERERTVLRARFGHRSQQSFYVRYGDWFAALCTFVVAAALARKFWITAVEGTNDADDGRTGTAV